MGKVTEKMVFKALPKYNPMPKIGSVSLMDLSLFESFKGFSANEILVVLLRMESKDIVRQQPPIREDIFAGVPRHDLDMRWERKVCSLCRLSFLYCCKKGACESRFKPKK